MKATIISGSGDNLTYVIKLDDVAQFQSEQRVNITRTAKGRSQRQAGFYWAMLSWCTDKGGPLRDAGHYSPLGLHESIKAWYQSAHNEIPGGSTTQMSISQFSDWLTLVINEFLIGIFHLDLTGFFAEYDAFCAWREEQGGGTWAEWKAEVDS